MAQAGDKVNVLVRYKGVNKVYIIPVSELDPEAFFLQVRTPI